MADKDDDIIGNDGNYAKGDNCDGDDVADNHDVGYNDNFDDDDVIKIITKTITMMIIMIKRRINLKSLPTICKFIRVKYFFHK